MAKASLTPSQRYALLQAKRLNSWPECMTAQKAASLRSPAHINVEATYSPAHFEMANFEDLTLDADGLAPPLQKDVRYRVEGVLTPGPPRNTLSAGYHGPELRPFVIEALTCSRTAEHLGHQIRAYRSLGSVRPNNSGGHLEPRQSRFDVLAGQKGDTVYVAAIKTFCRAPEAYSVHIPCRRAWQSLFAESGPPSLFWSLGGLGTEPPLPPAELTSDPAEGVLAVRERFLEEIHKSPNGCGVDAVIMAFSQGTMCCLRMGEHRVLRRTGATTEAILWEHTNFREPPSKDTLNADIPLWMGRIRRSAMEPGPPPCAVHSAPVGVGDRLMILSGDILGDFIGHVSDKAVADALGQESPDAVAEWLEAMAARFPNKHDPTKFSDWGLVVVDVPPCSVTIAVDR